VIDCEQRQEASNLLMKSEREHKANRGAACFGNRISNGIESFFRPRSTKNKALIWSASYAANATNSVVLSIARPAHEQTIEAYLTNCWVLLERRAKVEEHERFVALCFVCTVLWPDE